ncbi:MAG: glycosyltransferase [Thalassolituus oleivorans]|uniref:glycosyltransferase n=1 Tax=Thalassolituus oleivorans TaxID=187493 RepID=UPI001B5DE289|nr:glycosyltransferase [Thalassolituus oleivorans]MBQ0727307.1 glycosyltransferase [Thalassolituus oleivorans]MBQ0780579.1 glycosyltransferase [Thalassolituus oleivorans]
MHQMFLSVVIVVRNQSKELEALLSKTTEIVQSIVTDHELIIVDNGSLDESVEVLRKLTAVDGLPNLQVFALTKEIETDAALWVGCENSLGDYVAVIDPLTDDITFLPSMLEESIAGADVVFANNLCKPKYALLYRFAFSAFQSIYKFFNQIDLANEAPSYRIVSKRVINFVLQHSQPSVTYRHLPASGGFTRSNLEYKSEPATQSVKPLSESIQRGMKLIVSTTQAPMRLVTLLSLFGACANLIYSVYVVAIWIFKDDVAPGWVSLSLQQSGMFFLISLVLLVLGEYILHMTRLSDVGPNYHIAQEFTSARLIHKEKLNIAEATDSQDKAKGKSPL